MSTQPQQGIPAWTQGDRLRKARAKTGLNTRDFAALLGVSHGTITNAEGDKRGVRLITLKAWARETGTPIEWLEHGTAPTRPGPGGGRVSPLRARRDSNSQPSDPKVGVSIPKAA